MHYVALHMAAQTRALRRRERVSWPALVGCGLIGLLFVLAGFLER